MTKPNTSPPAPTDSSALVATSDAIDNVNTAGAAAGIVVALLNNPIAAATIGGLTALGTLLGARSMQKQVDRIAASARYLAERLDEAGARIEKKLEREEVVEVVHEAIKDTLATSYDSNRRRIADVVVNGLLEDADTRALRIFEKAAANLDDTAIEVLANLALSRPDGKFDEPHVRAFVKERHRLQDGPFGAAAIAELVRYSLVYPEEIADEVEVTPDPDDKSAEVTADIDRTPPRISETGRQFLAWVSEPRANAAT